VSPDAAAQDEESQLLRCICQELQLRQALGASAILQEYLEKYPHYAPQLQAAVVTPPAVQSDSSLTPIDGTLLPQQSPSGVNLGTGTAALPDVKLPDYTLQEELGRGGMGVVYKAWQIGLKRVVALKMILAGSFASPELRSRFRAEAEAVAALQHPNIVQIYEIGELDGCAYFAMEYIPGPSLNLYLQGQPQPPREAAQLVMTLALAIHSAHKHGIIHRDLKPANVLLLEQGKLGRLDRSSGRYPALTAQPRLSSFLPKLTDFGLARRIDQEEHITGSGQAVGTPSYMAPEQARRQDRIGPTTDVYALGAILYELLTGRPPFRAPPPVETLLQMLENEPVPPHRLQPQVPTDLETICLKCLAKEQTQRYSTAKALAEDLHRYLQGEPIQARPTPGWERAWKWAQRRPAVAALLGVSFAALVALLGLWWSFTAELQAESENVRKQRDAAREQRAEAESQRTLAETNYRRARAAVDKYLLEIIADEDMTAEDLNPLRHRLLASAQEFYQEFVRERRNDPELRAEQAQAYRKLATITSLIGTKEEAARLQQTVIAIYAELTDRVPDHLEYRAGLASAHAAHANYLRLLGRYQEALLEFQLAIAMLEGLLRRQPGNHRVEYSLASTLANFAWCHSNMFESDKAMPIYERSRALLEKLLAAHPTNKAYAHILAGVCHRLSGHYTRHGKPEMTEALLRRGLELRESLLQDQPDLPRRQASVGISCNGLGRLFRRQKRYAEARAILQRGQEMFENAMRQHPSVHRYRMLLSSNLRDLGELLHVVGELEQAEACYNRSLELVERLAAEQPQNDEYQRSYVWILGELHDHYRERRQWSLAETLIRRALPLLERMTAQNPHYRQELGAGQAMLARLYYERGQQAEAEAMSAQAIQTLEQSIQESPTARGARTYLRMTRQGRAEAFTRMGRHQEALHEWNKAFELSSNAVAKDIRRGRALTLAYLGDHAKAVAAVKADLALKGAKAEDFLLLIRLHAVAARSVAQDTKLSAIEKEKLVTTYQSIAWELLERAQSAGLLREANFLAALRTETDFQELRADPRFARLTAKAPARIPDFFGLWSK
jgi:serine/threonine-protein kinase